MGDRGKGEEGSFAGLLTCLPAQSYFPLFLADCKRCISDGQPSEADISRRWLNGAARRPIKRSISNQVASRSSLADEKYKKECISFGFIQLEWRNKCLPVSVRLCALVTPNSESSPPAT